MKLFALMAVAALLLASVACSKQNDVAYKDNVQKALEQADLKHPAVINILLLPGTLRVRELLNLLHGPSSCRLFNCLWSFLAIVEVRSRTWDSVDRFRS